MYLATTFDLEIEKMEVKKTFVHEYHEEKIYMKLLKSDQLPESFSWEDTWSGTKINLLVWF
jgi:hypothetical protein